MILSPRGRLNVHQRYTLTVVGTPPLGVTGVDGLFLDGTGSGQPGSDFTTTITRANLVVTHVAKFHARAAKAPRAVIKPAATARRPR